MEGKGAGRQYYPSSGYLYIGVYLPIFHPYPGDVTIRIG